MSRTGGGPSKRGRTYFGGFGPIGFVLGLFGPLLDDTLLLLYGERAEPGKLGRMSTFVRIPTGIGLT